MNKPRMHIGTTLWLLAMSGVLVLSLSVMALAGGVLTLLDTRLVLVVGGALAVWAALAMRSWSAAVAIARIEHQLAGARRCAYRVSAAPAQ